MTPESPAAQSGPSAELEGPWEAVIYQGHDTAIRPWVVRKRNPCRRGGYEYALTRNGGTRRFGSEKTAADFAWVLNGQENDYDDCE